MYSVQLLVVYGINKCITGGGDMGLLSDVI